MVVLDVGLPDLDGFEVLHRLRAASEHVCVLFLTARDAVADRVAGITAGADDYVTNRSASRRCWLGPAGCCAAAA